MLLENGFEVARPSDTVWELLMDVPQVVSCVPGATLVDTLGEDRWKAELRVQLGPMSMVFDSDVTRADADRVAGTVRLVVKARERSGRGAVSAEIRSALSDVAYGTRVTVQTDIRLQGTVARVGRSEIIEDVSQQMTDAFSTCLKGRLSGDPGAAKESRQPTLLRMALTAIFTRLRLMLGRHG